MNSTARLRAAAFMVATLLLFASYGFNAFAIVPRDKLAVFQSDSDSLVVNAVRAASEGSASHFGGFMVSQADAIGKGASLYRVLPGTVADAMGRSAYVSQFGLQSVVLSTLAPADPRQVDRFLERVRLICALLLAAVLAWGFALMIPRVGWATATATLVALACSPWLILFARSLYWQAWTLFLPPVAVAAVFCVPRHRSLWLAAAVAFATVLFRELMSYEYGTNVILATGLAIVIVEAASGASAKTILTNSLRVQVAAGMALGTAILAHLAKLAALAGSWATAIDGIRERLAARSYGTAASGFAYQTTGPFREFMSSHFPWCSLTCQNGAFLGRYLALPALNIPGVSLASIPIGAVLVVSLAVAFASRSRLAEPEIRAWRWALALSVVWTLSWAIVMPHHMLNHLHINGITWYLPFLPVGFAFLARRAVSAASERKPA